MKFYAGVFSSTNYEYCVCEWSGQTWFFIVPVCPYLIVNAKWTLLLTRSKSRLHFTLNTHTHYIGMKDLKRQTGHGREELLSSYRHSTQCTILWKFYVNEWILFPCMFVHSMPWFILCVCYFCLLISFSFYCLLIKTKQLINNALLHPINSEKCDTFFHMM